MLPLLGVGGGTAAALLILAWIIRGALSSAVEHAAKTELAKLDASLKEKLAERRQDFERDLDEARRAASKDLESYKADLQRASEARRQDFERGLDETRRAAAKDLEAFKVDLQLASEVRRQVAAKKVEAIVTIASLGEALLRDLLNVRSNVPDDRAKAMVKVHEYVQVLNANSFLFEGKVVGQFRQHAANLMQAETDLNHRHDASAIDRAMKAADAFLQLAREELGVVARAETGTTAAPAATSDTAKKPLARS